MNKPVIVPQKVAERMLNLNEEIVIAQRNMNNAKGMLYDILGIPENWVMRHTNNTLIIVPPDTEVQNEDS